MSTTVSIPVSVIFFPITLPIALLRLVVAGVTAAVISPVSLITYLNSEVNQFESAFGYARKYKILKTETRRTTPGDTSFRIREVLVRPGFISALAGAKSRTHTLLNRTGTDGYGGYGATFLKDGSEVSPRLKAGVANFLSVKESQRSREKWIKSNLNVVRHLGI